MPLNLANFSWENAVRTVAAATFAFLILSTAACRKTAEGETEVTLPTVDIDVGTKKDTVRTPTVSTQKDTLIVNRPVVTPPPQ